MTNPYLREFQALAGTGYDNWTHRDALVEKYAWAIPTDEAIAAIVAVSPIVEIGAGTGYWAKLIQDSGADILAYDIAPPLDGNNAYRHREVWCEILDGDTQAAGADKTRTLMLCWPPYDNPMAIAALEAYEGNTVVYIGEHWGGCNATDEFFNALDEHWTKAAEIMLPQWDCIHDYLTIWKRKEVVS